MTIRRGIVAALLALTACNNAREASNDHAVQASTKVPVGPVAASKPSAASPGRSSQFTTLDEKKCKTTYEDRETGDWAGLCPGLGPISLELSSGDLRDDLEIVQRRSKSQLGIPTIVANGAFDSIGPTLEWRGPSGAAPDVLVARVHVGRPDGTSDKGRLIVVRLGEKPCIVAVVPPQAGQSDKARAIADGKLPACLSA